MECDDGNPCTTDYCIPSVGCIHQLNDAPCNDEDACTSGDQCNLGTCLGNVISCDDANPCTDDSCDALMGCLHEPNSAPCNDSNACTDDDHCEAGECTFTTPTDCDDLDPCTTDSCDSQAGCEHDDITPCCSNGAIEPGEECDDGNLSSGDGCDESCQEESQDLQYLGFATWQQSCGSQSDVVQDAAMDATCKASYGNNARAATNPELIEGLIVNLPGSNSSGQHLILKCPHCEGQTPYGALDGHARACVNPGAPWPTAYFPQSTWNDHCCSSSRTTVCVPDQ